MAVRPIFYLENDEVRRKNISFNGYSGVLTSTQRKKSIASFHEFAKKAGFGNVLEVSCLSDKILGSRLCDEFFLKFLGIPFENVFYSSEVFENGGPYRELMTNIAVDSMGDPRLRRSGELQYFEWNGERWELEPPMAFYDYIYCNAVKESLTRAELDAISQYDAFSYMRSETQKTINLHVRRVAFVQLLLRKFGEIPTMSRHEFCEFHKKACARL